MTDFRALCAELHAAFTTYAVDECHHNLLERARAALTEPEPEGPTVMQIIELSDEIEAAGLGQIDFARAVLARWGNRQGSLDSSPPANSEVAELARLLRLDAEFERSDGVPQLAAHFDRAAYLLQRQYPQPVPVSERLPGPEDRNSVGKCWWFCFKCPGEHSYWILGEKVYCDPIYWLPAHALPIPTAND